MITRRTKMQLVALLIGALLLTTYVGARYARLDRLIYDTSYNVNAHFVQSGGIFTGAEVTYRGVRVGQVSAMKLTSDGVDVVLAIDNSHKNIPADTEALVGNKSAVGEQYVELQPNTDSKPYLTNGSSISSENTKIPISTTQLLTNLDKLVNSVPQDKLRTVISELGAGFEGAGPSLAQIIDTSASFIETANKNFATTTALIRDSETVLKTQADKESAIRSFARDLSLFSGTLAASDEDLRALIDSGSATANQLRTFLEQNQVDIGRLVANLVTTGKVVVAHLPGIRQILVLYPYEVAGGYTVTAPGPGGYDAHFGMVLQQDPPTCRHGYESTRVRTPQERGNAPMNMKAHCAEPPSKSNARGAQNAPPRTGAAYRAPVATYDSQTGKLVWTDQATGAQVVDNGGEAQLFGKDSWKWMLLQPAMASQE